MGEHDGQAVADVEGLRLAPVGEEEHGAVGHHSVDVGEDELEGAAAFRQGLAAPRPSPRRVDHLGLPEVVEVDDALDAALRVRHEKGGDLPRLHEVEGARGELAAVDEHRVRGSCTPSAVRSSSV